MKVLIVSHNTIGPSTNLGITLASTFEAFDPAQLAQLYVRNELPTGGSCGSSYRITDKDAMKGVFTRRVAGREFQPAHLPPAPGKQTPPAGSGNMVAYFGTLGLGRDDQLAAIGRAVAATGAQTGIGHIDAYTWEKREEALAKMTPENGVLLHPAVSREEVRRILSHCAAVIHTESFDDVLRVWDGQSLRLAYHCQSRRVILHVTPQFSGDKQHLKGGYYVLELARRLPDMVFMVAGKTQGEISAPENVIFLGMITDQQLLARYYSMADTTLLTSRAETFSMVCAESLCCGTPVIGFKAGGPEQIAIKEYSRFFEYGDLAALENGLRQESPYSKTEIAEKARERYAQSSMVSQYIALYQTLLDHRSPQRED